MDDVDADLATCLRTWRDRLDPAEAGLPRQAGRRAPGLRREEVAMQAGISVNYLMRLEQGRATSPSLLVVAALARTLRLNHEEAAHLHRLAGHAADTARAVARHPTPSIQRILDRFDDVPVLVLDPAWTIVEANRMARLMLSEDLVGGNAARNHFLGPQWVQRDPEDDAKFDREVVADLHLRLGRHPDDPGIRAIVDELRAASPRFAALWDVTPARASTSSHKTFVHPVVGPIAVDCDQLEVVGSDLRVVVWTAAPGTEDATALDLLRVVGAQRFEQA